MLKLGVELEQDKDGRWHASAMNCEGSGKTKEEAIEVLKGVIHFPPKRTVVQEVLLTEWAKTPRRSRDD